MKLEEGKYKFIQAWGNLGTSWGINKAMAQIHALLLISDQALTADEIMHDLQMSRGNVNMNVRALIDWGIVTKENRLGDRKDYFSTGKDILELAKQVSRERSKREIRPVMDVLNELQTVNDKTEQGKEFKKVTKDLLDFTTKVNGFLDTFSKSDKNWFLKMLMRL